MESVKYVGLDVHQSTISVAVLNAEGKVMMQSVIATKATAVRDLLKGLRGVLHVTFEEGTHSAWLYDVVVRDVARVVVCNPRKNALLKSGNKSDQIDARKLAERLRAGMLAPVYHGEQSTRILQQLVASYTALTEDTGRAMRRIKALCQKHPAAKLLRSMPFFGPLRAAVLIARVQTPHRFRTKRQFWTYCGLGLETRSSADYVEKDGQILRRRKPVYIRGLNWNYSHELKNVFKSTATTASAMDGPFRAFYETRVANGMLPAMARLTLARKMAAIALILWKRGETFAAEYLKLQAA